MALIQGKVRIIGGEWRSRVISFPSCADLRPTPDRVRETLFNWLGQDLNEAICLDLFAGSGVLGFEAASRRAEQVVMVESDFNIIQTLRDSKEKLRATQVQLIQGDALKFIKTTDLRRFNIIFLDPPYRLGLLPELLSLLSSRLIEGAWVYIETNAVFMPDKDWVVWRSGQAGKMYYQLLKRKTNG